MGYSRREDGGWLDPAGEVCPACWPYSTSPSWALIVAQTLTGHYSAEPWDGFALRTTRHPEHGPRWHASFRRDLAQVWAEGMTPEEAICLAALLTVSGSRQADAANGMEAPPRETWNREGAKTRIWAREETRELTASR